MPLPEDWRAFIESLNSSGVEYLIVGAVALAHHGVPRFTGGLDIFIRSSPDNSRRMESALNRFGFSGLGLKAADFMNSNQDVQLGLAPNRIDVLTSITGVTFDEAWKSRVQVDLEGLQLSFIGQQALIQNKRANGRSQDIADLERLE